MSDHAIANEATTAYHSLGGTVRTDPRAAAPRSVTDGAPVDASDTHGTAGELSAWGLTLVLIASFMVVLDFSIVNVALPRFAKPSASAVTP